MLMCSVWMPKYPALNAFASVSGLSRRSEAELSNVQESARNLLQKYDPQSDSIHHYPDLGEADVYRRICMVCHYFQELLLSVRGHGTSYPTLAVPALVFPTLNNGMFSHTLEDPSFFQCGY